MASTPPPIVVVGLGPGDPGLRTIAAQRALDDAERIVLRTRVHPGLDDLRDDPRVVDCDDLYQRSDDFAVLYAAAAQRVLDAAAAIAGSLVYAVPGHPRFGERSVRLLQERAAALGRPVVVQNAVSALDAILNALGADPFADGLQIVDALDLTAAADREPFAGGSIGVDPARPLVVGQIYAPPVAAAVKLALSHFYPDDHEVALIRAAGVPGAEEIERFPLHALDRRPVDHLSSLWLPALPALAAHRSPLALQRIVARLRAPGGCPWDRDQSHRSLRGAVIEEAYETLDAIDADDPANLAEELGDLLLQTYLHAQIAEEAGTFSLEDVYQGVAQKLLRRHPHVFGDVEAETPEAVVATWEAVKATERKAAGLADQPPPSPLDRLPRSMPALRRAVELFGPRLGAGLHANGAIEGQADVTRVGDALLAAAVAAIAVGIDPEGALEGALRRRLATGSDGQDAGARPSNPSKPAGR